MNQSGTVSAVIPAYNAARTIIRAVRSALEQTRAPIEVIVVDDGSIDSTADLVQASYPEVRVIKQENAGPARARNTGIWASRGDYIAFLDADDRWLPEKLAKQIALLEGNAEIALVASKERRIGREPWHEPGFTSTDSEGVEALGFHELLRNNIIPTSSVMIRTDVVKRLGGFDVNIPGAEDFDLWLRIAYHHPIRLFCQKLIEYHVCPSSLSANIQKMIGGELLALSKWEPGTADGLDARGVVSPGYYAKTMQWWRLKFALRCYSAGDFAQGRSHLKLAAAVNSGNLVFSCLTTIGWLCPRTFLRIGMYAKKRVYGRVL